MSRQLRPWKRRCGWIRHEWSVSWVHSEDSCFASASPFIVRTHFCSNWSESFWIVGVVKGFVVSIVIKYVPVLQYPRSRSIESDNQSTFSIDGRNKRWTSGSVLRNWLYICAKGSKVIVSHCSASSGVFLQTSHDTGPALSGASAMKHFVDDEFQAAWVERGTLTLEKMSYGSLELRSKIGRIMPNGFPASKSNQPT